MGKKQLFQRILKEVQNYFFKALFFVSNFVKMKLATMSVLKTFFLKDLQKSVFSNVDIFRDMSRNRLVSQNKLLFLEVLIFPL